MMWESSAAEREVQPNPWFHINYLGNKGTRGSHWGLNKAAVLEKSQFKQLISLFEEKTGRSPIGDET